MKTEKPLVLKGRDYVLGPTLRRDVVDALHHHLCEVRFLKKDGTKRVMQCTLLETFLPPKPKGQVKKEASPRPPNLITVWDVTEEAWKMFDLSRFLRLTTLD